MGADYRSQLIETIRKEKAESRGYFRTCMISEEVRVKRFDSRKEALHEYNVANHLFRNNISVPEPYKFLPPDNFFLRKLSDNSLDSWYLVMRNIGGVPINFLLDGELEKAVQQYKDELRKVLDLGILPEDSTFVKNSIYSLDECRVYLLDFGKWREAVKSDLELFDEIIEHATPLAFKNAFRNMNKPNHLFGTNTHDNIGIYWEGFV